MRFNTIDNWYYIPFENVQSFVDQLIYYHRYLLFSINIISITGVENLKSILKLFIIPIAA